MVNSSPEHQHQYYLKNRDILLSKATEYRRKHREELRIKAANIRKRNEHRCLDCGKMISMYGERCKQCAMKLSNAKFKKTYPPCVDCGKELNSHGQSIRCRTCAAKASRRGEWLDDNRFIAKEIGYIMVRDENGKKNGGWGYICEHQLVWERAHNKKLPKGWHIHHLNGIKTDNRIINLVALPSFKHYLVLAEKAKRIQELEALLRQQGQLI